MPSPREKLDLAQRAVARFDLRPPARLHVRPWTVRVEPAGAAAAARISAGATAFVLAAALRARGSAARLDLVPGAASVRFADLCPPAGADLFARPGPVPVTERLRGKLERAAAVEGVALRFVDDGHAVLLTPREDAFAQFVAGFALARVLLTATAAGVPARWAEGGSQGRVQAVVAVGTAAAVPAGSRVAAVASG